MLTPEECKAIIQFLDRTQITGHGERQAMNTVVQKLAQMSVVPEPTPSKKEDIVGKKTDA